jgi:hypothetical protein
LLISGLNYVDSDALVKGWSSIGPVALGKLSGLDHEAAVLQLVEAAKSESLANDGALLGALLKVRFGDGLDTYIESLLSRLEKQRVNSSCSLLDAFAYIAVMHALGLEILSRQVLSEVLYCSPSEIRNHVLAPLGMESAISSDGMSILTRHGEVGRRAVALLGQFGICSDQSILDLAQAARSIMVRGGLLPNASDWHYSLPETLISSLGRTDLAIEIVHLFQSSEPNNLYFLVKLSSLYRDVGDPLSAVRLFRDLCHLPSAEQIRAVLMEWGLAEARNNNHALGLALMFFSVADFSSVSPPSYKQGKLFVEAVPRYLTRLYKEFPSEELREAAIAVSTLGLQLRLDKDASKLLTNNLKRFGQRDSYEVDVERETEFLRTCVIFLSGLFNPESIFLFDRLCSLAEVEFSGLAEQICNVIDNDEYG